MLENEYVFISDGNRTTKIFLDLEPNCQPMVGRVNFGSKTTYKEIDATLLHYYANPEGVYYKVEVDKITIPNFDNDFILLYHCVDNAEMKSRYFIANSKNLRGIKEYFAKELSYVEYAKITDIFKILDQI